MSQTTKIKLIGGSHDGREFDRESFVGGILCVDSFNHDMYRLEQLACPHRDLRSYTLLFIGVHESMSIYEALKHVMEKYSSDTEPANDK